VVNRHLDVEDGIARKEALRERVAHAFFDRRDELAGDSAADNLVLELEPLAAGKRLDPKPTIAVLAAPARLALVLPLRFRPALDRFLVGNLGRLQFNFYIEFSLELFDRDLDMHLAGPRQDDLVRLGISMHLERSVLLHQLVQRRRRLLLVALGLGPDGEGDDRRGTRRRIEQDRRLLIAQRIAGYRVLELGDCGDLPGKRHGQWRLLLSLQTEQLAKPFPGFAGRVVHRRVALRAARYHAKDRELARE